MHPLLRIANRHRGQRVAVIRVLEGDEAGSRALAAIEAELERDLHRDLHGDRPRLREEDVLELAG